MLVLILIMVVALLLTTGVAIWILYRTGLDQERTRLVETVKSQARLIEAIAREEATHEEMYGDVFDNVVLGQIIDAHHEYEGFGRTGEFTLARREGDLIVFLLGHRHVRVERPDPVPFQSPLAEPMRRALNGESGTMVGLDYAGATVLAAYEPVPVLEVGLVAKIDLQEVRSPFVDAGKIAVGISLLVAIAGAFLVVRVSSPLITELEERSLELADVVAALSESEERFRTTYELAGIGIAQVALDGRFIDVNPHLSRITGYTAEEMTNLSFQQITHPDDLATDLEYARQLLAGEIDRYSMEKRYLRKDSSEFWVNLTGSVVRDGNGDPQYFIAIIEDVASRKHAEAVLKKSLREKDVLLREVHHRVKNNMQVISSLLSLQASSTGDDRLSIIVQESQSRVRAMALIHEILYESSDLTGINLEQYLSQLAASLTRMYGAENGLVQIDVEPKDITLGIDATVPCGLAINELISNSLKHGYPDARKGQIGILVRSEADDELAIVVRDDGVGMPPDIDIRNTDTMGLGLVVGLVEKQLGGRLELDRSRGTRFTIIIDPQRPTA